MNKTLSVILVGIIVIGAGIWWYLLSQEADSTDAMLNEPLLELTDSAADSTAKGNAVQALAYATSSQTLTLRKNANGEWTIDEKNQYYANPTKVNKAIQTLLDANVIEYKTAKPQHYHRFGLAGNPEVNSAENDFTSAPFDSAQRLVLTHKINSNRDDANSNSNSNEVQSRRLLFGKSLTIANKPVTYVRKPNVNHVLQVKGKLTQTLDADQWLDKDILSIDRDRIQSIIISSADGSTIKASRLVHMKSAMKSSPAQFIIDNVPEQRELLYPNVGDGLAEAINNLQLENVWPAKDKPITPKSTAVYTTHDGLIITAKLSSMIVNNAPEYYLQLDVSVDESKTTALKATKQTSVQQEAQNLQQRVAPWTFQIAAAKANFFSRRMADILKPLPEPKAESAPASGVDPDVQRGQAGPNSSITAPVLPFPEPVQPATIPRLQSEATEQ